MYARIAGTGSLSTEKILTNSELEALVDTSDEWIRTRTGIEQLTWRRRRDHDRPCRTCVAARDAGCRGCRRGYRSDLRRHDDARSRVSERGHAAAGPLGIHGCPAFSLEAPAPVSSTRERGGQIRSAWANRRRARRGSGDAHAIIDWKDRGTVLLVRGRRGRRDPEASPTPGSSARACTRTAVQGFVAYPDGVSKGFHLVREGKGPVCR